LLACLILILSGCTVAGRQPGALSSAPAVDVSPAIPEKYAPDADEMMPIPYTPRDDGIPLTPSELYAFKTVGDLDRDLSEEEAHIVELHFKYFLHEKRETFERFIRRSARFLPYVRQVFSARGIPDDIAYLLMVESGGNPLSASRAGAVGLWQFIPSTGKKYGLYQSYWVDERRDPYKSTLAAADYLLKLYNDFANWHLAVAAYNAGEGKIGRAISGTGASDFFELCRLDGQLTERARLKNETRNYVPRLIAISKIMRNLDRLGFAEPDPSMAWELTSMSVPPGTSLTGMARHLGYSWEEFKGMNPAYLRSASPPTSSSTAYVSPDKLADALRWAAGPEARVYAGWREYTVRRGDTMRTIAKRHGVSVAALRQANGIQNLPRRGTVLLIPGRSGPDAPAIEAGGKTLQAGRGLTLRRRANSSYHTVQKGDTMFSLALKWGTDVASIQAANGMDPRENDLRIGQKITIPANSKKAPGTALKLVADSQAKGKSGLRKAQAASGKREIVTVRKGDTLYGIARAHKISVDDLLKANNLPENSPLQVGRTLIIP
jgi:membrane-bound lytic murein transglycosylase D